MKRLKDGTFVVSFVVVAIVLVILGVIFYEWATRPDDRFTYGVPLENEVTVGNVADGDDGFFNEEER